MKLAPGEGSRSPLPFSAALLARESFVSFGHDLIHHGFHVLRAFPHHQLPVRTRALAHDPLDVRDLGLVAEI